MDRKNLGIAVAVAGAVLLLGGAAFGGGSSGSGRKIQRISQSKLANLENITSIGMHEHNKDSIMLFKGDKPLIVRTLLESWPTYDETLPAGDPRNNRKLKDKEKIMLLAIAINESTLIPYAMDTTNPDNPAKTLFQLSKNEFAESLSYFGLDESDVIPPIGTYGNDLIPYIQNQAEMAMRFAFMKGLAGLRSRNSDRQLLGLSALWTGCGGGSWTRIVNSPIIKPVFDAEGYSVTKIPSNDYIKDVNKKIRASAEKIGKVSCVPPLLNRLMTFRQLMDALTEEVEV